MNVSPFFLVIASVAKQSAQKDFPEVIWSLRIASSLRDSQ